MEIKFGVFHIMISHLFVKKNPNFFQKIKSELPAIQVYTILPEMDSIFFFNNWHLSVARNAIKLYIPEWNPLKHNLN